MKGAGDTNAGGDVGDPGKARGLKLAVVGASGRMGRAVVRLAGDEAWGTIVYTATRSIDAAALRTSGAQVLIDFSSADICANVFRAAAAAGVALVSGTTGLNDEARGALLAAAETVAVLSEANMSVGVHVLAALVEEATRRLGPSFHAEIVEVHHAAKVDAPSGTALLLSRALDAGRGDLGALVQENGREGRPGARKPDALGIHAVRGGDVIGDHTVHLLGKGERLELTHRATDRDLFARGALRAAAAIAGKPAGRYSLGQLLMDKSTNT